MTTIRKLDKQTINSIAAGEVVERPASVAKELIDNSLDAGASIIRISIKAGGIKLLEVEDNGFGMTAEDAVLALESHATSKLSTVDDLLRIETMGFRGEALASIAAVSRLELATRLIGTETGTSLKVEGGNLLSSQSAGMKEGTTVSVSDLFFNTPARYKFLKTDRAESSAIVDMVGRLALARPDVSFLVRRLEDKKDLLHTPGNNDLLSAIYAVFGRELAEAMEPVDYALNPVKVQGFMTMPKNSRHNRRRQLFIVNKRVIQSPTMQAAVDEAGKTWFMKGRFPALVLHLDIPAELVDVNVHPRKSEIRVWDEKILFRSVYHALQETLSQNDTLKDNVLSAHFMPAQDDEDKIKSNNIKYKKETLNPTESDLGPQITFAETGRQLDQCQNSDRVGDEGKDPISDKAKIDNNYKIRSGEQEKEIRASNIPEARYIGNLLKTYLLFEVESSLFIIDQHAAHERILYEKLLYRLINNNEEKMLSQTLLLPVRLTVSAGEMSFFLEYKEKFSQLGFDCDPFSESSIVIRAVPSSGSGKKELDAAVAFRAVLEHAVDHSDAEMAFNKTEILHDIACKAAVKANDNLSRAEAESLLASLLELDNPYHCPHGRPTIIRVKRDQIEKMFGRIV